MNKLDAFIYKNLISNATKEAIAAGTVVKEVEVKKIKSTLLMLIGVLLICGAVAGGFFSGVFMAAFALHLVKALCVVIIPGVIGIIFVIWGVVLYP